MQKKISVWLTLLLAIITCAFGYGAGLDAGSQSSYDSGYETGQADALPPHYLALTAAMRGDLDSLQALLPGYVTP
mgnify:CR=1 FL=1